MRVILHNPFYTVQEGAAIALSDLLTRSDMPEEHRQEGLKVVFSGIVAERSFPYDDLNRIPLQLTKIRPIDSP